MSDISSRKALDAEKLLEWLLDLYHGTGDRTEKYAYGRVEQSIESGTFDIPVESDGEISSLITTIESQKETLAEAQRTAHEAIQRQMDDNLETLKMLNKTSEKLIESGGIIESQKEEIETLRTQYEKLKAMFLNS